MKMKGHPGLQGGLLVVFRAANGQHRQAQTHLIYFILPLFYIVKKKGSFRSVKNVCWVS